jgi:hypothetical protein
MNINLIILIVAVLFLYSAFTYFIIKKKTRGCQLAFDLKANKIKLKYDKKINECKLLFDKKNKEYQLEFIQKDKERKLDYDNKISEYKLTFDKKVSALENKVEEYSSLSEALVGVNTDISEAEKKLHEEKQKIAKSELSFIDINGHIGKATDKLKKTIDEIRERESVAEKHLMQLKSEAEEIQGYKAGSKALLELNAKIASGTETLNKEKSLLVKTIEETKELQELKNHADKISQQLEINTHQLKLGNAEYKKLNKEAKIKKQELHQLMSKIDLYIRLDDFLEYGFFEEPEYLYETSLRFAEEIKRIRGKQKELIKNKAAVTYPASTLISDNKTYNNQILGGQVKLMLTAFNIECDTLISKISPSNFSRTLERIDNLATTLEKSAATLFCGFSSDYVELKFEECKFQYQYKLKKQKEQEEQNLIREQMREEQKATKEYEKAVTKAERELRIHQEMLEKAKIKLNKASNEERIGAEERISYLELQLMELKSQKERALSMAEQTKRGFVYVISNVGSFGKGIYKVGLTRRLEPLDRVKELGGASVPFVFDVHAMIYAEDAPKLESDLHKELTHSRVNAVNLRKEFFRTDLESIKEAVKKIAGTEEEFKTTILADDYYETLRLQREDSLVEHV